MSVGITGISGLEAAALRLASRQLEERAKDVQPGKGQTVDVILRLQGILNRGADGTSTRQTKPNAEVVLAWILSRMSAQARDKLGDDWAAAIAAELTEASDPDAQRRAENMLSAAARSVTYQRSGALTGAVNVSLVDVATLKPHTVRALEASSRLLTLEDE